MHVQMTVGTLQGNQSKYICYLFTSMHCQIIEETCKPLSFSSSHIPQFEEQHKQGQLNLLFNFFRSPVLLLSDLLQCNVAQHNLLAGAICCVGNEGRAGGCVQLVKRETSVDRTTERHDCVETDCSGWPALVAHGH